MLLILRRSQIVKIRLLVDEQIANVIEKGHSIGPKQCIAGEEVEVYEGAGELLIAYGRAEKVKGKAVTKELEIEEKVDESQKDFKSGKTQKGTAEDLIEELKPKKSKKPKAPKSKTPEPEYNNIWDNISDPISEPVSKKQKK